MPRLPTAEDLGTRVARPTRGVVQIAPDPMGGAIAGIGGEIGRIADEETRKLDELSAQDALNTLERKRLEFTYGTADKPESGFQKVTGSAVLSRPLLKEVPEAFDSEISTLAAGLKTNRARQYFQQRAANVKNGMTGDLFRHVALQTDKAHDDIETATLDNLVKAVAVDPSRLDWALSGAAEVATKNATRHSVTDPDMLAVLKQGTEGKVVVSALKTLLSSDTVDINTVNELLKKHEAIIPADALLVMKNGVRKADIEQTTGVYVRDLLADPELNRGDAGKKIEAEFGKDPDKLKAARFELGYQFDERERVKRENEDRLLNPVNTLIGDALNNGKAIGKPERDRVLSALRVENPEIYAKAAGAIDQHNDEIRNERRAAESHYRAMADSSPDAKMRGLAMKADMLGHPEKFRNADMKGILLPMVRDGKLRIGDAEELIDLHSRIKDPAKRAEMTTLLTGNEYMNVRLNGVSVNGKKFTDMDKKEQQEIRTRALMAAEPLLQNLQASGTKASTADVKKVIDSLFTERRYRETFLGISGGLKTDIKLDEPGAAVRFERARVEKALRDAGYEPTEELINKHMKTQ